MPDFSAVDPALLEKWLSARSKSRGLPQPVADHGGLRVDTGSEAELARYVFAAAGDGLRQLAEKIDRPRVFLKACATQEALLALLPDRWQPVPGGYLMIRDDPDVRPSPLPDGFRLEVETSPERIGVRITSADGRLAASGYAAEFAGVFAYDRIRTEAPFRRMGLGTVVMTTLGAARPTSAAHQVLVATEEGRALYSTLGWSVRAPYSTAVIPG
jgi:hypothetical protein